MGQPTFKKSFHQGREHNATEKRTKLGGWTNEMLTLHKFYIRISFIFIEHKQSLIVIIHIQSYG